MCLIVPKHQYDDKSWYLKKRQVLEMQPVVRSELWEHIVWASVSNMTHSYLMRLQGENSTPSPESGLVMICNVGEVSIILKFPAFIYRLTSKCRVSKKVEDIVSDPEGFQNNKHEGANENIINTYD